MIPIATIQIELTDVGQLVWWATVDKLPGFSAAADTLDELRNEIQTALTEETAESYFVEALAGQVVKRATQYGSDVRSLIKVA